MRCSRAGVYPGITEYPLDISLRQPMQLSHTPVNTPLSIHIDTSELTQSERVLACCAIAKEKLETGDYDSGCAALEPWWTLGKWPRHSGLTDGATAELLLVSGALSGWVASSQQIPGGRKPAEALLSGAIA